MFQGQTILLLERAPIFSPEFAVMARAKSTNGTTKSDLVREYLRSNPDATANEIMASLKAQGVSLATAHKVRYLEGLKRGGRGRKPGRAGTTASSQPTESARGTKANAIRDVAQTMTQPVRPRDVVAALAGQGITVSRTQVSQVLTSMGMRRRRRGGRKGASRREGAAARSATPTTSQAFSLDALIAAKKLANQLGGISAAKQAVDALARLS
jgi:arginine repressor